MTAQRQAISLEELTRRVTRSLAATPGLDSVWITAETSDVRTSGGHCYMELLQKDSAGGSPIARTRAVIWASTYTRLGAKFAAATGSRLASDMKIMVKVTVSFHSVYGFSLVITDIDPDYTVGDLARKRNEILSRLNEEGVAELNRSLPWSPTPYRIAIISAAGAAGYGDFMKHLHLNGGRLRFETTLFPATLQGENTAGSVIGALDAIMARVDDFDCVTIIRGGGAVSDLASFDDYELASNVAQFPLPIIVGIGHERDITVLDFVANTRVKTPTAAAELLIGRMTDALGAVVRLASEIQRTATERISGARMQLAYYQGLLPALTRNIIERHRRLTDENAARMIAQAAETALSRRCDRLAALGEILEVLSPEATLRRGYSITRVNGKAVTDSGSIVPGTRIETTLSQGKTLTSITE